MKIFEKFGKTFLQLDPKKRKLLIYLLIGFLIAIMAFSVYQSRMAEKEVEKQETPEAKFEEIVPEVKVLQRSLYYETQKKTKKLEKRLLELERQLQQQRQELEKREEERKKLEEELTKIRELLEERQQVSPGQPEKVQKEQKQVPQVPAAPPPIVTEQVEKEEEKPSWVGGIGEVVGEDISKVEKEEIIKEEEKIQEKEVVRINEVYLPPSFVSADLLNGFAAFVASQGKQEPVRAFFRLRDLAVLPNEVKSDLKGCFVIGEAYGNLADERAHVRLLRLSCIARDGSSVIDAPVKGWVVDEDGKAGLRGRVVTKMGALLLRVALAGLIEGMSQAYAESLVEMIEIGEEKVAKFPSPKEAFQFGLGRGLGASGRELSKFYMDLAKQTLPVIEVGAGKRVTIVFTEGTNLKIQKTCIKGRDGCVEPRKTDGSSILTSYYGTQEY